MPKGDGHYALYRVKVIPAEHDAAPDWSAIRERAKAEHADARTEVETPVLCPGCGADALSDPFTAPAGELRQCTSCGKATRVEELEADDIAF